MRLLSRKNSILMDGLPCQQFREYPDPPRVPQRNEQIYYLLLPWGGFPGPLRLFGMATRGNYMELPRPAIFRVLGPPFP